MKPSLLPPLMCPLYMFGFLSEYTSIQDPVTRSPDAEVTIFYLVFMTYYTVG